jgi:hypothetical protein
LSVTATKIKRRKIRCVVKLSKDILHTILDTGIGRKGNFREISSPEEIPFVSPLHFMTLPLGETGLNKRMDGRTGFWCAHTDTSALRFGKQFFFLS